MRPMVVGTRVTQLEKSLIEAAALSEGVSVGDFLRKAVVPAAHDRLLPLIDPAHSTHTGHAGEGNGSQHAEGHPVDADHADNQAAPGPER